MTGRTLGDRQRAVLSELARHGRWEPGGGWIWNTYSETRRILDSLVRRGLVAVDERSTHRGGSYSVYTLTDEGRTEVTS